VGCLVTWGGKRILGFGTSMVLPNLPLFFSFEKIVNTKEVSGTLAELGKAN